MNTLYLREIRRRQGPEQKGYPFSLPAVQHLNKLTLSSPVTFFIGENGAGKSTLLEAVAVGCGFNPEGGSKNFSFSSADTHSSLHEWLTLVKGPVRPKDGFFLRAESFYNVASEVDRLSDMPVFSGRNYLDYFGGVSLHEQSHGESFMALMIHRFWGKGVYILDEPEAALSPTRQLAMLARIAQLVREDSQFIIATHSPILMAYPGAQIFSLEEKGIFEMNWEETEHYKITRRFLENPGPMLRELMREE